MPNLNDSAGVLVVPPNEVGRGYGSLDLHARHLADIQARMEHANPKVLAEAVAAARDVELAKLRHDAAELEVRRVAGDYTGDVMKLAREEARRQLAAERVRAELVQEAARKPFHIEGVSVSMHPLTSGVTNTTSGPMPVPPEFADLIPTSAAPAVIHVDTQSVPVPAQTVPTGPVPAVEVSNRPPKARTSR